MYHTHFDEFRQQYGGLVGALVVLEPGEQWDPEDGLEDVYLRPAGQ